MRRWNYELRTGRALRQAIENGDYADVLVQLENAYAELRDHGYIDEDDYDRYTESFMDYLEDDTFDDDEEFEETVDFELSEFYDLCDNIGVWVTL